MDQVTAAIAFKVISKLAAIFLVGWVIFFPASFERTYSKWFLWVVRTVVFLLSLCALLEEYIR